MNPSIQVVLAFLVFHGSLAIRFAPDIITEGHKVIRSEVFVSAAGFDENHFILYRNDRDRLQILDETKPLQGLRRFQLYAIPSELRGEYENLDSSRYRDLRPILFRATARSDWHPLLFTLPSDDPTFSQKVHFRIDAMKDKELVLVEEERERFGKVGQSLTEKEVQAEKKSKNSQRLWVAAAAAIALLVFGGLRMRKRLGHAPKVA